MEFSSAEEKIIYERLISHRQSANNNHDGAAVLEQTDASLMTTLANGQTDTLFAIVGDAINTMETTRVNHAYRPLHSARRIIGGVIVFVKRTVRKCLKWYIEPISFQQTEFNNAAAAAISGLRDIAVISLSMTTKADEFESRRAEIDGLLAAIGNRQDEINNKWENALQMNKKELIEKYESLESALLLLGNQLTEEREAFARKEEEFNHKYRELLETQNVGRSVITDLQDKMDKLRELDLDVFSDKGKDINPWDKRSFAQTGEDMILFYILFVLGFSLDKIDYLDLGANHAKELSNTYHFYQRGARGVLVEANPELIPELKFYRSGDVVLNRCVADKSGGTIEFYVLNGDGLSTPDKAGAEKCIAENPALKIERVVGVETISVNDIIENHMGKAPTILNIDIEGNEMGILKSIDFEKYRPVLVITEMISYKNTLTVREKNPEILAFMESVGYIEYAFTGINSIFLDKNFLDAKHLRGAM